MPQYSEKKHPNEFSRTRQKLSPQYSPQNPLAMITSGTQFMDCIQFFFAKEIFVLDIYTDDLPKDFFPFPVAEHSITVELEHRRNAFLNGWYYTRMNALGSIFSMLDLLMEHTTFMALHPQRLEGWPGCIVIRKKRLNLRLIHKIRRVYPHFKIWFFE